MKAIAAYLAAHRDVRLVIGLANDEILGAVAADVGPSGTIPGFWAGFERRDDRALEFDAVGPTVEGALVALAVDAAEVLAEEVQP